MKTLTILLLVLIGSAAAQSVSGSCTTTDSTQTCDFSGDTQRYHSFTYCHDGKCDSAASIEPIQKANTREVSQEEAEEFLSRIDPAPGKLVVYRLAKHWNRAGNAFALGSLSYEDNHDRWSVMCDGKQVSEKLRVNQYAEIAIAPGPHSCKVKQIGLATKNNPETQIEVQPGSTAYMRMRLADGMGGRWHLDIVPEDEALAAVEEISANKSAKAMP